MNIKIAVQRKSSRAGSNNILRIWCGWHCDLRFANAMSMYNVILLFVNDSLTKFNIPVAVFFQIYLVDQWCI